MNQPVNKGGRPPKDRLMDLPETLALTCVGKTFIYAAMSQGRFPAPIKLGRRAVWRLSDVEVWIANLKQTATKGEIA